MSCDVTKPSEIEAAIKIAIERFGKIDVLSNNAGISADIICEEETLEHMKYVMDTNFFGTFNTIKALLPHFRMNKNGTIVNNSSQSGLTPRLNGAAYVSSKHAIEGLTGVLKLETVKFCRVMCVELGFFSGTNVMKNMKRISCKEQEYQNNKEFTKIYDNFINDLDSAINIIINQVEQENLPRHLILGHDAVKKIKYKVKEFSECLKIATFNTQKCSKYNKEFTQKVIKKIFKKLIKLK